MSGAAFGRRPRQSFTTSKVGTCKVIGVLHQVEQELLMRGVPENIPLKQPAALWLLLGLQRSRLPMRTKAGNTPILCFKQQWAGTRKMAIHRHSPPLQTSICQCQGCTDASFRFRLYQ